jgi:hypothetical protein
MIKLYLTLLLCLFALPTWASALDYKEFGNLPMVEDGRIKPLASFASNMRMRLTGSDDLNGEAAIVWLARSIFNPARAADDPVFMVVNAHLRAMFSLPERKNKIYTLAELAPGLERTAPSVSQLLEREAKRLSRDEQDLLTLHTNVLLFNQLLQSFSLLLPLPLTPPEGISLPDNPTYLDVQKIEPELAERLRKALTADKIEHPEKLKPAERELALFMHGLQQLREGGTNNQLLRIIPAGIGAANDWYAPWQLLLQGKGSPATQELLQAWQALASAYLANDAVKWKQVTHKVSEITFYNQGDSLLQARLKIENAYRSWHLYGVATGLLVLALGLCLPGWRSQIRPRAALWLGASALLVLCAAISLRIFILARPPVGTLHESVLFVALIMLLGTLLVSWRGAQRSVLFAGLLGSLMLLAIAPGLLTDSENMTMLNAVLNTNFWLTVHVLCITAGYGACALTAALAHVQLFSFGSAAQSKALPLLHRCSLVALLLTAIGTLLGGVWADQSWGRFWGWDPKENGAMIIVLWLLWLQHGRMAGQIGERAFLAGMAALGVVVAQAWFGVNLLSTGLHSYGFIEGIAAALFGYTALNLLLIAGLWARAGRRTPHAAPLA